VWALSEAEDKESTQLHPKNKILAHKKYALSCRFSPDSRYSAKIFHSFSLCFKVCC
jgi:hypothetical protein